MNQGKDCFFLEKGMKMFLVIIANIPLMIIGIPLNTHMHTHTRQIKKQLHIKSINSRDLFYNIVIIVNNSILDS